jgi:hypothetical protein
VTYTDSKISINQSKRKSMKIKFLLWIAALAGIVVLSASVLYPSGAPEAKTGSPGDAGLCTDCHGGTATTTAGLITSNIPAEGYVPGTTYQITATNPITGTGRMGFEVSPQNVAGALLGTLIAGSGSQLNGSGKYVTHASANTTTSTWTFSWVAPVAGTGSVTFYGAFAKRKPGPVVKSSLVVQEQTTTGISDFSHGIKVITTSGGTLNLDLNTEANQAKVMILDLSGRVVLNTSVAGKGSSQLNLNHPTGVYLIVVEAGKSVVKKKIFVN